MKNNKKLFIKNNYKWQVYVIMFLLGFCIAIAIVNATRWFNDNYYIQFPIKSYIKSPLPEDYIYSPELIPEPVPYPSPLPTPELKTKAQIIKESKYPDFIDHIWERETGRGSNLAGLNGYCLDKGMTNEFGFAVSVNHCFTDFQESIKRLERWYEETEGTYNQKLCYYNKGIKEEHCAYLTYNFKDMN